MNLPPLPTPFLLSSSSPPHPHKEKDVFFPRKKKVEVPFSPRSPSIVCRCSCVCVCAPYVSFFSSLSLPLSLVVCCSSFNKTKEKDKPQKDYMAARASFVSVLFRESSVGGSPSTSNREEKKGLLWHPPLSNRADPDLFLRSSETLLTGLQGGRARTEKFAGLQFRREICFTVIDNAFFYKTRKRERERERSSQLGFDLDGVRLNKVTLDSAEQPSQDLP